MAVTGRGHAEPIHEFALHRGLGEQILAAQHVSNGLKVIVHHNRQRIGKQAVFATQHHIPPGVAPLLRPQDQIVRVYAVVQRKAQGDALIGAGPTAAAAAARRTEHGAGAGAGEQAPARFKRAKTVAVGGQTCRLIEDAVVPGQTVMFQAAQDRVRGAGHFAGRIEVFDTQQPLAPVMAGIQVAAHGGEQGTEVQGAGGGGREASPVAGRTDHARGGRRRAGWWRWAPGGLHSEPTRGQPRSCRSLISSRVLQSMHSVAVGRASRRLMPISTPQASQKP